MRVLRGRLLVAGLVYGFEHACRVLPLSVLRVVALGILS